MYLLLCILFSILSVRLLVVVRRNLQEIEAIRLDLETIRDAMRGDSAALLERISKEYPLAPGIPRAILERADRVLGQKPGPAAEDPDLAP